MGKDAERIYSRLANGSITKEEADEQLRKLRVPERFRAKKEVRLPSELSLLFKKFDQRYGEQLLTGGCIDNDYLEFQLQGWLTMRTEAPQELRDHIASILRRLSLHNEAGRMCELETHIRAVPEKFKI